MKIQIFQDTVCPWCRIGKQNLLKALSEWQGEAVELEARAYMLDASIPEEGLPFRETMLKKFGGGVDLSQVFSQVVEAGKGVGVGFDFDRVQYMPNTRLSHRLISIVPQEVRLAVLEAVNRAYFEEGQDIGNLEVLLQLAQEAGLDKESYRTQLEQGAGEQEVTADLNYGQEVGITGVPFFIVNDRYALTGAQPASTFLQALKQIEEELAEG